MICSRCKKDQSDSEFEMTRRGQTSKRCKSCTNYLQRDTTCKRCLKTFPIEEFAPSVHGKRITYCRRCAEVRIKAHHAHAARIAELNKQMVLDGQKICPRCRATKDLNAFRDERGYVRRVCIPCREYMMQHTRRQRVKWTPEKLANARERECNARRALRKEVIEAYGAICNCCGEDTIEFLAIDHVNGDGGEHRRQIKAGANAGEIAAYTFYYWLRSHGYPKGFQVLCHNCNGAKGYYGTCPHRKNPLLLVETGGLGPMVVKSSGAPRKLVN